VCAGGAPFTPALTTVALRDLLWPRGDDG
jgi:hypothetical protein